jgi:undecaprenyl-diphosphatase
MSLPFWQAVLLGLVQGLTEFLPVSSTTHLALVQHVLPGFSQPGILFDVMLHVGTLAAVLVYYRERLLGTARDVFSKEPERNRPARRLVLFLLLSVALTGAVALPLKGLAEEGMTNFRRMGFALLGTAVLLTVAQRIGSRRGEAGRQLEEMRPLDAAILGICQAASAVFHGLSRSGNTISVGLFCGLSRKAAAEYSFLLSIPTILAAAAVENLHALKHDPGGLAAGGSFPAYLAGMLTAAVVGYFAVAVLIRLVVSMKLHPFIVYCALLGGVLVLAPMTPALP